MPTATVPGAPAPDGMNTPPNTETDLTSLFQEALKADSQAFAPKGAAPAEPEEIVDDDELPEPTGDDDQTAAEPTEPEPETPETPASPQGTVDTDRINQWAEIVAFAPHRLSEVSPKHHPQILDAAVKLVATNVSNELIAAATTEMEKVRQSAYNEGLAAGRQAVSDQAIEGELEALAKSDPEEFARVMLEDPQRMARFAQRKAFAVSGTPELLAEARDLLTSVAGDPYAREFLAKVEQSEPTRYQPTKAGLANLKADIIKAQVESGMARERASATPASTEAQRRRNGVATRQEVPVTAPSGGGAAAGGKPSLPDDNMELAALAVAEERARFKR